MGLFSLFRLYPKLHNLRFIIPLLISPAIFATILDLDHLLAFIWSVEDGRFLHIPAFGLVSVALTLVSGLRLLSTSRIRWVLMNLKTLPYKKILSFLIVFTLLFSLVPLPVRADLADSIYITDPDQLALKITPSCRNHHPLPQAQAQHFLKPFNPAGVEYVAPHCQSIPLIAIMANPQDRSLLPPPYRLRNGRRP